MKTHHGSILLVDDEEKILKALGRALRDAGNEVIETTSPRHAQRLLAERPFDLLIVDNMMPELSGLDLIREFVGADGRQTAERGEGAPAERTRGAGAPGVNEARGEGAPAERARGAGASGVNGARGEAAPAERVRGGGAPGVIEDRPQIVMMTAHATVESAIEAMKLGAFDYLQKPFDIDELLVVVRRALDHQRLRTEYRYLLSERDEQFDHYGIIGRSRAMQEVIRRAELVAETKSTVLISGETGTGKELVARAIHDRSAQRDMPLIKVNCAAIPETLLESELFGHVRGAFTGAMATKKGKFALADGGTIFLDEIGTMSPTLQAKLLRVRTARFRAHRES
jgi:DNA-binding NtrC family response regulator